MALNIFFDVDHTIIGYAGDLRPGVREMFSWLQEQGHTVYIWSGMGVRWDVIDRHQLRPFVAGCYAKPLTDHHQQLVTLGVPVVPDFCVDDHQEIIDAFGGVRVRAYDFPNDRDSEFQRLYGIITEHTASAPTGG